MQDKMKEIKYTYLSAFMRITKAISSFISVIAMQSGLAIENAKMYEHVKTDYIPHPPLPLKGGGSR